MVNNNEVMDKLWNHRYIVDRATQAFLQLQDALVRGTVCDVKDFLSDELTNEILEILTYNQNSSIKIYLPDINIKSIEITGIKDIGIEEQDSFNATISYSLIGYVQDCNTNQLLAGSKEEKLQCYEHWHFVRRSNDWFVDAIYENIAIGGKKKRVYTEMN